MRVLSNFLACLVIMCLLCSKLSLSTVSAQGTIYIRADGSIDPPTVNITTLDSNTYTFTDSVTTDSIVVERDNIIIDGAGHTLQGTGTQNGLNLNGRNNVTVKNLEITGFYRGFFMYNVSGIVIQENNIHANSLHGVYMEASHGNEILSNNMTRNDQRNMHLDSSADNVISGNNISDSANGLYLQQSIDNTILGNCIANNTAGLSVDGSGGNTIQDNVFVNDGLLYLSSYSNVVVNNLVNGKPLVCLRGVSDLRVENAGQVVLVNCNLITVEGLTLTNTTAAVELWSTNNSTIVGNHISDSANGIYLESSSNSNCLSENMISNCSYNIDFGAYSSNNKILRNIITDGGDGIYLGSSSDNNTVSGNTIMNNQYGISMQGSHYNQIVDNNISAIKEYALFLLFSSGNTFLHNNLINNLHQVHSYYSQNVWDIGFPEGGNYWSDYLTRYPNASEIDGSGIWNISYYIDSDNVDHYPIKDLLVIPEFPLFLTVLFLATILSATLIHRTKRGINRIK